MFSTLDHLTRTTHFHSIHITDLSNVPVPKDVPHNMRIVSFCASVITSVERWRHFRFLVASMIGQTIQPTTYYFSIHIEPALEIKEEEILAVFQSLPAPHHVLRQKRVKHQFSQYQELSVRLRQRQKTASGNIAFFISFTDDDDLWHPTRIETFIAGWNAEAVENQSTCFGIFFMEQCYHIKPNCCVIRNVADVNKAIKCGCIQYHYPVATTIYPGTITLLEHPDICVRDYVFSEFLTKYSFLVAHNRFTDLCFSTEMQLDAIRHSKKRCVQKIQVKSWKYFHRMHCNTQEYQRSKLLTCEAAQKAIIKVDNELDLIHILEQVSEWREIAQLRNWEIGFRTSLESTVEPLKIPLDQIRQCYEKVLLKRDQLRKSFLG